MEQILLSTFSKHIKDKKVVENSQHAFLKWEIIHNQCDTLYGVVMRLLVESSVS